MKAHTVLGPALVVALTTIASAQSGYVYTDDLQSIEREMLDAAELSLPSTQGPSAAVSGRRLDPNVTPAAAARPVGAHRGAMAVRATTDDTEKRPSFFSRLKPKWPFGGDKSAAEPAVDPFAAAVAARREALMQRPQTATPIPTKIDDGADGGVATAAYGQRLSGQRQTGQRPMSNRQTSSRSGAVATRANASPQKGLLESIGLFGSAEPTTPQRGSLRPPTAPTQPTQQPRPLAMRTTAPRRAMNSTNRPAATPKPGSQEPAGEAYVIADSEPSSGVVMISDSSAKPAAEPLAGKMPVVQGRPQTGAVSSAPRTNPYATTTPRPLASLYSAPSASTKPRTATSTPELRQPTRPKGVSKGPAPSPLVVAGQPKRIPAAKPFPRTQPAPRPAVASTDSGQPSERARALLAEANGLAQQAATVEDHSAIVQRCRYVLAIDQTELAVDYANQLAGWSLNKRGELLDEEGRLDEASVDFHDAIGCDAECWRAIHNLGVLEARRGDRESALRRFDRTIELNPEFAKAHSNRAALAVQAGEFVAALEDYQQAIDCDPDLAVAHTGRGRVCHMLGHLDSALRHLDAAQVLSPEDAMIASGRGDLLVDLGRYGQAKQAYERAIALAPESPTAYRNLAWMQATCPVPAFRDGAAAMDNAVLAEQLTDHVDDITLDTKAAALAAAGHFDEALEVQEQAIEIAPDVEVEVYRERLVLYSGGESFTSKPVTPVRQAAYESGRLR